MIRDSGIHTGWPLLCFAALFGASEANAAGQGSLGATSTGSVGISASIATQAAISGSGDIGLAGVGKTSNRVARSLCLSSNSRSGAFTVAAMGGGRAGAFELSDGHRTIGYTVGWASAEETSLNDSGTAKAEIEPALSQADCRYGSGPPALIVAIGSQHLEDVQTGASFAGVLTLMVSPG